MSEVIERPKAAFARRLPAEGENGGAQSGTGFIWDAAGHIVTNDHVVGGTSSLAVRLATGQVLRAHIVGAAPNYDLAVIRVDNIRSLPPPVPAWFGAPDSFGRSSMMASSPSGRVSFNPARSLAMRRPSRSTASC